MRYSDLFEYKMTDWDLMDAVYTLYQKSNINANLSYPKSKHKDREKRVPRIRQYYWNGSSATIFIQPGKVWIGTLANTDDKNKDDIVELSKKLFDSLRQEGLNPIPNGKDFHYEPVIKIDKDSSASTYIEILKKVVKVLEKHKDELLQKGSSRNVNPIVFKDTMSHVLKWIQNNKDKHDLYKMDRTKAREKLENITRDVIDIIDRTRGGSVPTEQDIWNLIPKVL